MTERLKKGYLQWRCRRGTKELDVVLNRFLENKYSELNDKELVEFNELLDTQDTQLWYWLSAQEQPKSLQFQQLIKKITNK